MDRVRLGEEALELREQAIPPGQKRWRDSVAWSERVGQGFGSVDRRDIGHRQPSSTAVGWRPGPLRVSPATSGTEVRLLRISLLVNGYCVQRCVRPRSHGSQLTTPRGEWERVRLLSSRDYPELCGLTFPEIAERLGVDEWDAYFDILAAAGDNLAGPSLIATLFTEEMSAAHVRHPLFLLGADTMSSRIDGPLSLQTRNPLHFAAHMHYLVHHVRDARTLSLEEAIRKMTSMVATRFELRDRGLLRAGAFADVAVFDPDRLAECSTIEHPLAYAIGFEQVFVNGVAVIVNGQHTGARPDRFLAALH